jgi:uncharacterized integral membrane protein (TIGR00698 family)
VAVAVIVAMAATLVAERYGSPAMLFALLIGMAFHFLSLEGRCPPGIDFAAKQILRLGVAMLGARITAEQIAALGPGVALMVVAGVVLTILFGWAAANVLRIDRKLGVLTGGAVAICGASAALAIAAVLPKDGDAERNTIFTVIGVTTLSTAAMVLYPLVVAVLGFDDTQAGIFLGASIHDVAQVVGAGFSISTEAGNAATVTKLFRVALLVPVVFMLSLLLHREKGRASPPPLPGFLIGFVLLVILNSVGAIPEAMRLSVVEASRWCLIVAIAALGMKTSVQALGRIGMKPVLLMVAETVFLALLVMGALLYGF